MHLLTVFAVVILLCHQVRSAALEADAEAEEDAFQARDTPPSELVRIVNNGDYKASKGRLELFVNRIWSPIFDMGPGNFGEVACRMLGYPTGSSIPGRKEQGLKMLIKDIKCGGDEKSIFDCKIDRWGHEKPWGNHCAWVECKTSATLSEISPNVDLRMDDTVDPMADVMTAIFACTDTCESEKEKETEKESCKDKCWEKF